MARLDYLYNNGDQCAALTGGWTTGTYRSTSDSKTAASASLNAGAVSLSAKGYCESRCFEDYYGEGDDGYEWDNEYGAAYAYTINPIDLTQYDVLHVSMTGDARLGISTSKPSGNYGGQYASGDIDVSGMTGLYYLSVAISATGRRFYDDDTDYVTKTGTLVSLSAEIYNKAPNTPGVPQPQDDLMAGQETIVSWESSIDPDDDAISYVVERAFDSDAFVEVGVTDDTQYSVPIPAPIRPGDVIPISWEAVSGADGYAVERSINGGAWEDLVTTSKTTHTDTAPSSNKRITIVKYRVACVVDGVISSDYTESADVGVYVSGGEN